MRFRPQSRKFGWKCAAAVLLALPMSVWAQSADLVANNAGPSQAQMGEPFEYQFTLTNNGLAAANGATFLGSMPANAVNVTAVCTLANAGATCPSGPDLVVSNTQVSGRLPAFPNQGEVLIVVKGNFGIPSPTSVGSTLTIATPQGVSDPIPGSNSSTVNTTLSPTETKLTVGKTQNIVGELITYTITLKNEGPAPAHGALMTDVVKVTTGTGAANVATEGVAKVDFVSCVPAGGAQCPADNRFGEINGRVGNFKAPISFAICRCPRCPRTAASR